MGTSRGRRHMKRRIPLKRTPMRRRRGDARNSYARRERDFQYMSWVKTLPCRVSELDPSHRCDGPSEADHIGDIGVRGLGTKAADSTVIPLCPQAHRDRTGPVGGRAGFFAGWTTLQMRAWAEEQIARYQKLYEERVRRCAGDDDGFF